MANIQFPAGTGFFFLSLSRLDLEPTHDELEEIWEELFGWLQAPILTLI
jgi:hypothetical protein